MLEDNEELKQLLGALRDARDSLNDPRCLARILQEIRSMCRARLSTADELRRVMDSQDLGQDVLFELVRASEGFRGRTWEEFWAFAGSVIDNRMRTIARRHRTGKRDLNRRASHDLQMNPKTHDAPGPFTTGANADDKQKMLEVIAKLPDVYRKALERRLESASYSEIARAEDISEETARKRVSRALSMLKENW